MTQSSSAVYSHPSNQGVKAILFDWDGTMVDSLHYSFEFWRKICIQTGKPFPLKDLDDAKQKFKEPFMLFYDEVLGFDFEKDDKWIKPAFVEYFKPLKTPFREGILDVLRYSQSIGLKNGIVSSNVRENIEARLSSEGISFGNGGLISCIIAYRFGVPTKPDPTGLLEGAKELSVSPDSCVYVGDMPSDVQASRAAGMVPIWIAGGYGLVERLDPAHKPYIANSVQAIIPILDHIVHSVE